MARATITPTGVERLFGEEEIIVSKTDLKGRITYSNKVFQRVSGFEESELLGMPHSMIRHPNMPRSVFHLLWDTIQQGNEIFAYVVNVCKNGDHYWVFAHVTPTFNDRHEITGFHSSRRFPDRAAVEKIESIYRILREEEQRFPNPREAAEAGRRKLTSLLEEQGVDYSEFVFSLANESAISSSG